MSTTILQPSTRRGAARRSTPRGPADRLDPRRPLTPRREATRPDLERSGRRVAGRAVAGLPIGEESPAVVPAEVARVRTPRPVQRPVEAGVRLTRRGRLVLLTLSTSVLLVAGTALAAGSGATAEPGAPEPTRIVVVAPGDTLWDIAAEAATLADADVRDMVVEIQELNDLDSGMLQAGQDLRVPLG